MEDLMVRAEERLCIGGCGFFGRAETGNYCSRCYAIHQRNSKATANRSQLACARSTCRFRVHSKPELGGYCCIVCWECGDHGPRCQQVKARPSDRRADPKQAPMSGDDLVELELEEAISLSMKDRQEVSFRTAEPAQPPATARVAATDATHRSEAPTRRAADGRAAASGRGGAAFARWAAASREAAGAPARETAAPKEAARASGGAPEGAAPTARGPGSQEVQEDSQEEEEEEEDDDMELPPLVPLKPQQPPPEDAKEQRSEVRDEVRATSVPSRGPRPCPRGHQLVRTQQLTSSRLVCDGCDKPIESPYSNQCKVCDFDLCDVCYALDQPVQSQPHGPRDLPEELYPPAQVDREANPYSLSKEQLQAVEEIEEMGFNYGAAMEAYVASGHNQEEAMSLLMQDGRLGAQAAPAQRQPEPMAAPGLVTTAALSEKDSQSVERLMDLLGFGREAVVKAYLAVGKDMELAAEALLGES